MINESYAPRRFKELSQSGTFRWENAKTRLPEVVFTPNDPSDEITVRSAEDFVDNVLARELARFATSAGNLREADLDPKAGQPGISDRNAEPGKVRVSGERNENWDGAIRSSRGRLFSGSMEMGKAPKKPNPLAEAFSLTGVKSMQTLSVDHVDTHHTESMELLKNSPQQIAIAVNTSSEGRHVYRIGPDGLITIE
jgi:hypothetical protein